MPLGNPMGYGRLGGLRQWVQDGGYASTGSRVSNPAPSGFTNLEGWVGTLLDAASELPTPGAMVARGMRAGTKAANASVMDDELKGMGFTEGLSFGQQLGAAFGFNSYGTGGPKARAKARQMAAKEAIAGRRGYVSQSTGPNARRGHRAGNQSGGRGESGRMGGSDFGDRTSSPGGMGGV